MKIKKSARLISVLLSVLLMVSLLPASVLAAVDNNVTLTIIHANDRHGRMGADAYISQLAKDTSGNVLILDAGDALHGQITANLSEGAAMVELMNEVGYSAMVAGNHEFTYGIERLTELSEFMDFPLLAANVKDADGKNLFQSCEVFKLNGVTVGVFGLATPETVASSDPRNIKGIVFDDPVEAAKAEVAELKAAGCDIIIALTHLGIDKLSDPAHRSDALAAVPGIDVIIDGHSHTELESGQVAGDALIAQTGEYGNNIGVVEIIISGGKTTKTAKLIPVPADGEDSALKADPAILAKIAELDKANEAITSVVVGHTPHFLQGEKSAIRTGQSPLADLITDSMRYATGADIAFMTGGNIRASIDAGDITMGEVLTTLPYSNLLTTVELSGADILKIMEHGVELYPEAVGHYIHVSGLRFTFDPNAESGNRVKNAVLDGGGLILPKKVYTVATIDFIAAGGDGYDMMQNGKNLKYYGGDAEAFVDYLATKPQIKAEAENRVYSVGDAPRFADVLESAWYYTAVSHVTALGFMASDGAFKPEAPVTEREACEMLDALMPNAGIKHSHNNTILTREKLALLIDDVARNGLDHVDDSGNSPYTDTDTFSSESISAIVCMYNLGVMRGVGDGRFDPSGVVTRAQMATVMYNINAACLSAAGGYQSLADFEGAVISTMAGAIFADFINPVVPGVTYKYYATQPETVAALSSGEADAIALDMPVAKYVIAENPDLMIFPDVVADDHYGFAVKKGSPLAESGNEALRKLIDGGVISEMEKIWFSADESKKTLPELSYKSDFDGSAGTLRFGYAKTTEPMSYTSADGKPLGFDLDIVCRIAYEINMKVEFIPLDFDELFAAMNASEVDMVGGSMSVTAERQKTMDFVGPYYDGGIVLVIKK